MINIWAKYIKHSTPGYLKGVFSVVHSFGVSVDLVATSTFSVSIVIEHLPEGIEGPTFKRMMQYLEDHGKVSYIYPCSIVSIVGYKLRSCLPRIGKALNVFQSYNIHLLTESSEDLNFSFVVEESICNQLVQLLHKQFFPITNNNKDNLFGLSWVELHNIGSIIILV